MLLKDKVAIITGSASGIGRAGALLFAAEGARVVVNDIDDGGGKAVVQVIRNAGSEAAYFHADINSVAEIEKLVRFAVKTYGKLDIYWSNAGVVPPPRLETTTEQEFDSYFANQVKAGFFGAKFAIPEIENAGGGSVLFTSSSAGLAPTITGSPAHSVFKAGLIMLARVLAVQYGAKKIRSNCICPGATMTGSMEKNWKYPGAREATEKLVQQTPLGRFLTAEEMAEAALFLASDKSGGITGNAFAIDCGRTAG